MKLPKFSIVTPVLNRKILLQNMVESVLKQSFTNFELLIVDNGSTDGTWEYCQNLNQEKIRLHKCEQKGVAFARNKGIREAGGEWIIILDSDNVFKNESILEELVFITEKFENAQCILTSNQDRFGTKLSSSKYFDRMIGFKEYLTASGEFTPLARRSWYLHNLHPEIPGIINEFSYCVFLKAALENNLVLSSYVAQIYSTEGDDRVCAAKIDEKKAYELYRYHEILLGSYSKFLQIQEIRTYLLWSLKFLVYGKLSNQITYREYIKSPSLIILAPLFFLPSNFLKFFVEFSKKRRNNK